MVKKKEEDQSKLFERIALKIIAWSTLLNIGTVDYAAEWFGLWAVVVVILGLLALSGSCLWDAIHLKEKSVWRVAFIVINSAAIVFFAVVLFASVFPTY